MDIYGFISELKYVAIFVGTFVEGPTVVLLIGVFSKLDSLNLYLALIVHLVADMLADSMYYAIGYFGGSRAVPKIAKYLRVSADEIEKYEKGFKKHSVKLIFFGQLTQVVGFPIMIAAAVVRYPWWKFFILDFIATALKAIILVAVGYYFGSLWEDVDNILFIAAMVFLLIILVQVAIVVLKRVIKVRNGDITLSREEIDKLNKFKFRR